MSFPPQFLDVVRRIPALLYLIFRLALNFIGILCSGMDSTRGNDHTDDLVCRYDSTWEDTESDDDEDNPPENSGRMWHILCFKKPAKDRCGYGYWCERNLRAASDMQNYRHGYPDGPWTYSDVEEVDESNMPNLQFYLNNKPSEPDGVFIEDFHTGWMGKYERLERVHSYIQWLFPLREPGVNYWAKELTLKEIEAFRNSEEAKSRLLKSYKLMLDFYGIELINEETGELKRSKNWLEQFRNLNRHTHNNLRITRILKCLGELGFQRYQAPLVRFFLEETLVRKTLASVKRSVLDYFLFAVRDREQRKELVKFAFQHYEPKYEFVWCPRKIQKRLLREMEKNKENSNTEEEGLAAKPECDQVRDKEDSPEHKVCPDMCRFGQGRESSVDPPPEVPLDPDNREMDGSESPPSGSLDVDNPSRGNSQGSGAECHTEEISNNLPQTPQEPVTPQIPPEGRTKSEMAGSTTPTEELHGEQVMERNGTVNNTPTAEQETVEENLTKDEIGGMAETPSNGPAGEMLSNAVVMKGGISSGNDSNQHDGAVTGTTEPHPCKNPESDTLRSEEAESHPVTGEGVDSLPVTVEDAESHPVTGEDSKSHPVTGEDSKSLPVTVEDAESHPVTGEDSKSHAVTGEDLKSHPVTGEDLKSHPVTGKDSESHLVTDEDSESHPFTDADSYMHEGGVIESHRDGAESGLDEAAVSQTHESVTQVGMEGINRPETGAPESHRPVGDVEESYGAVDGADRSHRSVGDVEESYKAVDGEDRSHRPIGDVEESYGAVDGANRSHRPVGDVESDTAIDGTDRSHRSEAGAADSQSTEDGVEVTLRQKCPPQESHTQDCGIQESYRYEDRAEDNQRPEHRAACSQMYQGLTEDSQLWTSWTHVGSDGQIEEEGNMGNEGRSTSPDHMIYENSGQSPREAREERDGEEEPMEIDTDV